MVSGCLRTVQPACTLLLRAPNCMQLRNIPATALLALEMVPHLCARGLEPMAHAAAAVMRSWGLPAAEAAAAGLCSQQAARAALLGLGAAASSGGLDSSAVYT